MLRNKELRYFFALFFMTAFVSILLGFWLNKEAGRLAFGLSAVFFLLFLIFTKKRYEKIADLSEQIDIVLHNENHLFMDEEEEGELSILQSEIKKMTLRIREQNAALKKEKEHLADSLADIAHQLRTPLTSANLILSLLEGNPNETEKKMLLRELEELFAQMEWLINALLKLSRLDAGLAVFQKKAVNVSDLIHTALRPLLISMDLHDITIQTEIPKGMMIVGDLSWLAEALSNIFKNCMQSVGDHGKIEVTCEDTILFGQIIIHDSGPGFGAADLFHLFDRFYRGEKEHALGYGIGLALCKMIILSHGGTITAKNHSKGGALFQIRFPK